MLWFLTVFMFCVVVGTVSSVTAMGLVLQSGFSDEMAFITLAIAMLASSIIGIGAAIWLA